MKANEKKTESLGEIVFRHRNRSYGAYHLRRQYKHYITFSLIVALFVSSAIVTYPLVLAMNRKMVVQVSDEREIDINLIQPPEDPPEPIPPPPPPPEKLVEKVKFTVPVVVDDTVADNDFGKQDLLADNIGTDLPVEDPGVTSDDDQPDIIEQPEEKKIFTVVEENPQFPGGESAMYKYLAEVISYPEEAKELGIQGRVFVNFLIETDGSVTHVKVLRGIGGGCDEEAIRVVRNMPGWKPGKQRGIPVRVSFNLPIKFTLQ